MSTGFLFAETHDGESLSEKMVDAMLPASEYFQASADENELVRKAQKILNLTNKIIFLRKKKNKLGPALTAPIRNDRGSIVGYLIAVEEDFFNTLTQEEKLYIVGHELAHILNDDFDSKRIDNNLFSIASLVSGVSILGSFVSYLFDEKKTDEKKTFSWTKRLTISSLISTAYLFYSRYKDRQREYQADFVASTTLNCAQAGITALSKYLGERPSDDDEMQQLIELFSSHPLVSKRIYELKKLVETK